MAACVWPVPVEVYVLCIRREDRVGDGKAAVAETLEPGCLLQTLIILLARSQATARGVWHIRDSGSPEGTSTPTMPRIPSIVDQEDARCLILSTLLSFLMSVILPFQFCLSTLQGLIQGRWLPFLVHNWRTSTHKLYSYKAHFFFWPQINSSFMLLHIFIPFLPGAQNLSRTALQFHPLQNGQVN